MTASVGDNSVAVEELRQFLERIERLDEEIAGINGDKKDVWTEAKGRGFDTKAMRVILAKRRKDPSERQELDAIVELYENALGMG